MPLELMVSISVPMENSIGYDIAAAVVAGGSRKFNVDVPISKSDEPRENTVPESVTAGL